MSEWISVKDRLPEADMDNVLFTLYTPAWHDITDELAEDERDFPEEYVTVCGCFGVVRSHSDWLTGERRWRWVTSEGYEGIIYDEYEENYTGQKTYITHWMPLPEPPESEE